MDDGQNEYSRVIIENNYHEHRSSDQVRQETIPIGNQSI